MTVIRLGDGQLVLHSPVPIDEALRSELEALGPVGFLVVPIAHGRFAAEAARQFPSARVLVAPRAARNRPGLAGATPLADVPPAAWAGQLESRLLQGFRLEEVVLFHRPSRTLVITDLCFNIRRSDSRVARGFFRLNGMWQTFGPSRIIRRATVSDRAAFAHSIAALSAWDFERIVPGHGDVVEGAGLALIRDAWRIGG